MEDIAALLGTNESFEGSIPEEILVEPSALDDRIIAELDGSIRARRLAEGLSCMLVCDPPSVPELSE